MSGNFTQKIIKPILKHTDIETEAELLLQSVETKTEPEKFNKLKEELKAIPDDSHDLQDYGGTENSEPTEYHWKKRRHLKFQPNLSSGGKREKSTNTPTLQDGQERGDQFSPGADFQANDSLLNSTAIVQNPEISSSHEFARPKPPNDSSNLSLGISNIDISSFDMSMLNTDSFRIEDFLTFHSRRQSKNDSSLMENRPKPSMPSIDGFDLPDENVASLGTMNAITLQRGDFLNSSNDNPGNSCF